MDAKDFGGDDGGKRKRVEGVDEGFPDFNVAAAFAFVVKTVDYDRVSHAQQKAQDDPQDRENTYLS